MLSNCANKIEVKLIDGAVSPQISYNSNDARYNINNTPKDSYSKNQFYTDVPSSSLTSNDFNTMGLMTPTLDNENMTWDYSKPELSSDANKLVLCKS